MCELCNEYVSAEHLLHLKPVHLLPMMCFVDVPLFEVPFQELAQLRTLGYELAVIMCQLANLLDFVDHYLFRKLLSDTLLCNIAQTRNTATQ